MITNVIQMLHTTAAYQTAVMQLMINEANFATKQLDLKDSLPINISADTNKWEIDPPPEGVGGFLSSSNYSFGFSKGRLPSIGKQDCQKKIVQPGNQFWELSERPS